MIAPQNPTPRRPLRRKKKKRLAPIMVPVLFMILIALFVWLIYDLMEPQATGGEPDGPDLSRVSIPSGSSSASSQSSHPMGADGSSDTSSPDEEPDEPDEIDPDNPHGEGTSASDWNMILVSPKYPLPEGYEPELTQPSWSTYRVDARIAPQMEALYEAAEEAGHTLILVSAFRGVPRQTVLFEEKVSYHQAQGMSRAEAEVEAAKLILPPGTSEHHTGLAVDIVCDVWFNQYAGYLDDNYAGYASAQWLAENCDDYGFIIRYPADRTGITGVDYEPWHFRYVGVEAAGEIMRSGICLEEYLGKLN